MIEYEWNLEKARVNLRKHGIAFSDAVTVFADDLTLTIKDDHPTEKRFITLCMDASGRMLVVVYTHRGDHIRLISARMATADEIKQYQEG